MFRYRMEKTKALSIQHYNVKLPLRLVFDFRGGEIKATTNESRVRKNLLKLQKIKISQKNIFGARFFLAFNC